MEKQPLVRWATLGLVAVSAAAAFTGGYYYYAEARTATASTVSRTVPVQVLAIPELAQIADQAVGSPAELSNLMAVHVTGAVKDPGLHWVAPTARVDDVVRAAGGTTSGGALHALNLAARVHDGDKIYVPTEQELEELGATPAEVGATHGSQRVDAGKAPLETRVHLNRSGVQEWTTLPGIGPALAKRIVEVRKEMGGFQEVDDLLKVSGIGPRTLERLRDRLTQ